MDLRINRMLKLFINELREICFINNVLKCRLLKIFLVISSKLKEVDYVRLLDFNLVVERG